MCQESQDAAAASAIEGAMATMMNWSDSVAKTFLGQTMKKIGLTEHWLYYEWSRHGTYFDRESRQILPRELDASRVAREKLQFALEVRGRKWNPAWAAVLDEALEADLEREVGLKNVWYACLLAIKDADGQYSERRHPMDPSDALIMLKAVRAM